MATSKQDTIDRTDEDQEHVQQQQQNTPVVAQPPTIPTNNPALHLGGHDPLAGANTTQRATPALGSPFSPTRNDLVGHGRVTSSVPSGQVMRDAQFVRRAMNAQEQTIHLAQVIRLSGGVAGVVEEDEEDEEGGETVVPEDGEQAAKEEQEGGESIAPDEETEDEVDSDDIAEGHTDAETLAFEQDLAELDDYPDLELVVERWLATLPDDGAYEIVEEVSSPGSSTSPDSEGEAGDAADFGAMLFDHAAAMADDAQQSAAALASPSVMAPGTVRRRRGVEDLRAAGRENKVDE